MERSNVEEAVWRASPSDGVHALVTRALAALEDFMRLGQEEVDFIVKKASVAALDQHGELARLAIEETGRGVFEDKAIKNLFACEHVTHAMRHLKTVGVVRDDELTGITEIAEPVGVICGITPTTNPTTTPLFKALISLKTRNPIIFAFHPSAQRSSAAAARVVRDAAVAAGAPPHCVQWIELPSMEATNALMHHPGVALILATGGNAMVKAAYSCGKPALGVGAGNTPAYIEQSADVRRAVNDIVLSKTFDNGMICASEQAIIIDDAVYDDTMETFARFKVHRVSPHEKPLLENLMFGVAARSENCAGARLNAEIVGKPATWIAEQAGFVVAPDTVLLLAECGEVGEAEPLTREKLSPVLAVLRAPTTQDGIRLAAEMVAFHGLGHTAVIHSNNQSVVRDYGAAVKAVRLLWNAPASHGGIGALYNDLPASLTLGCGSYGSNSVSNNVGAVNLLNIKRIARRNNNMQWFKVPPKIFFEAQSIRYLIDMKNLRKVMIVTDRAMWKLGYVDKITDVLHRRRQPIEIELFFEVEADPSVDTVNKGLGLMRSFEPDTIIALGGGSPMDAAKVMWLLYENPEVNFDDLKQKFLDIRKRAFKYPELGRKARMVCIPTTSGTGAEVTPFAVITDTRTNKKYPLADYALTPTIAIVDPDMTLTLPAAVAADTGLDVLTHATEAYVSILANDFTDGLALQAIKLVFQHLERSVKHADPVAREKMHNASTIAGMAFANAFLGMCHAMAHKVGGLFHVPHGRANAILLPHVIRYNGLPPTKLSVWPKYGKYCADERYQDIAAFLRLPASTPEEGVASFRRAVIDLTRAVGIELSFQAEGVDEAAFLAAIPQLARDAYEDQCAPANPRLPLVADMEAILRRAYYGELD
ncbi:MAG: bifunctional acetaldehyde-CoA/alcohol dehydrogenase [Rhodocyclaceae bacterium]